MLVGSTQGNSTSSLNQQSEGGGGGMYEVAKLASGKHFGELALTTNKPRAATIKAVTTTHLLVLTK